MVLYGGKSSMFQYSRFFLVQEGGVLRYLLYRLRDCFLFLGLNSNRSLIRNAFRLASVKFSVNDSVFSGVFASIMTIRFFVFVGSHRSNFMVERHSVYSRAPLRPKARTLFRSFRVLQ